jgi:CheY-like chemotaxis protein
MEPNPIFLVIEDNLIDQLVISQLLKKVLHVDQIVIANNGREGIEWLTTKKKNQSLIILLDIQMPIMNGFEFLNA